jgi:hypothetical protein
MNHHTATKGSAAGLLGGALALAFVAILAIGPVTNAGSAAAGAALPSGATLPLRSPSTPVVQAADGMVQTAGLEALAIDTSVTETDIRDAIVDDAYTQTLIVLQSAGFDSHPPSVSTFKGVSDSAITTFPQAGSTFGLLSSGNVSFTELANSSGSTSQDNGYTTSDRGPSDQDTVILGINFKDPARLPTDNDQTWCLSVDFRFLTEEYPEWVGTQYNDAFIAELDATTWITVGGTLNPIVAPNNFAVTPGLISVNSLGTDLTASAASGTTYDGATPHYRAYTYLPPLVGGAPAHRVYFSVFDQGDHIYDSTVFLDNLRVFRGGLGDPCLTGPASKIHS